MISEKLINTIVKKAEFDTRVLFEVVKHIQNNSDWYNKKTFHFLEMLVDPKNIVTEKDIDVEFITNNISDYIYNDDNNTTWSKSSFMVSFVDCPKVLKKS